MALVSPALWTPVGLTLGQFLSICTSGLFEPYQGHKNHMLFVGTYIYVCVCEYS